ncbi:MAG TPA: MerR family DNA-binding transcriptional regulator [Planctomycetota bacterium]|nr:MerR family DNA-binding transcriptional regulator [Planctomycetota bacterium]
MARGRLYTIGEVIQFSGLSRQTLHNYTVFGLITEEERTPAGYRLYGEGVFERLRRIAELKGDHTLREIREIVKDEEP